MDSSDDNDDDLTTKARVLDGGIDSSQMLCNGSCW